MNKQDIIRMAREAGGLPDPMVFIGAYERFAALVASRVSAAAVEQERKEFAVHAIDIARKAIEEEREACARVCEAYTENSDSDHESHGYACAAAIRERSANSGARGSAT
jgi:hypothetical protein